MKISRVTLLLLCYFIAQGCSPQVQEDTRAERRAQSQEQMRQMFLRPSEDKVSVIAIKYGAPEESITTIVSTYLSNHDRMYQTMKRTVDSTGESALSARDISIVETIRLLSQQTGMEEREIASIIVDYQSWVDADRIRNQ